MKFKYLKGFLALFIILSVFLTSLSAGAVSVESKIISGNFRYLTYDIEDGMNAKFFYSDEYFSRSGKEKNEHLRTFSFDLAVTAFGSDDPDCNARFTMDLLESAGFSSNDISVMDMEGKPTADTIGTVISHKNTEYGEVIAVVVRGGGYELEWVNTLDIGESGDAVGLTETSRKVTERIKAYEKEHGLDGSKLLITGYSRAGAVSDLTGKYINEHLGEFGMTADDLYVYTFEAPTSSCTASGYENIHNVVNTNDPVPLFFSEKWGFYYSGVREELAAEDIKINYKQLEVSFSGVSISDKYTSKFNAKKLKQEKIYADPVSISTAEKRLVEWITSSVDRKTFADHNSGVRSLITLIYTMDSSERQEFIKYFTDVFSGLSSGSIKQIYEIANIFEKGKTDEESGNKLSEIILGLLESSDHSNVIDKEKFELLKNSVPDIAFLLAALLKSDYKETKTFEYFCTLTENLKTIIFQHFAEKALALAEIEDSYYHPISLEDAQIAIDETTADVVSVKLNGVLLNAGTDYSVKYRDSNDNPVEPEESGEYTAIVTGVGSFSGVVEKKFTAVFPHYHNWVFEQRGNEVSVKCTAKECEYETGKEYIVSLSANDKIYDGKPTEAQITKSSGFPEEIAVGKIKYSLGDSAPSSDAPTMPGDYTASLYVYDSEKDDNGAEIKLGIRIEAIAFDTEKTVVEMKENSAEVVSVMFDGKLLEEEKDYSVHYFDNTGKEIEKPEKAGGYTVAVEGKNIYSGRVEKEVNITNYFLIIIIAAAIAVVIIAALLIVFMKFRKRSET